MKLPKWVVKWVKDEFSLEEAELRISQLTEENARLRRRLAMARFDSLPKEERDWVLRTLWILWYSLFLDNNAEFIEKYMERRDEEEEQLPF